MLILRHWPLSIVCSILLVPLSAHAHDAPLDRTKLPIAEPERPVYSELDVRNVPVPPPLFQVKPPEGAPNVVVILIDDLGFGAASPFGGPITTPTMEKLAQEGLRFTNFHTTALCSPTRAALKSGRNHHMVNMGFITEMATGFPGATGSIPNATAPVAEMLLFEIAGNRAIYHDGWFARTIHKAPWEAKPRNPLQSDDWELFNVPSDFSLSKNIAATQADKLKELQQLFMKEAGANHVLPIDDRLMERNIC